jgi:DNA-binding NarL/FixJ family response regulator
VITVLTVNDCFLLNEGLRSILSGSEKLRFLHHVADESLLEEELRRHQPSVLIFDPVFAFVKRRDLLRREAIHRIREVSPATKLIFISQGYTPQQLKEYISDGVNGFLLYRSGKKEILEALIAVQKTKNFFCRDLLVGVGIDSLTQPESSAVNLSERELEIIDLMAKGLSSKEIREELSVSIHTINSHKKNIFRKLNINKASDLLLFAMKNGLVEVHS